MSYVPYDPNVWPAEPVDDSKSQRAASIVKWTWGIALYLIAIVAWVVWMKMPPKIQPPLRLISLSDGTQLRLIHYNLGKKLAGASPTFDNRIRTDLPRGYVHEHSHSADGAWMIFTHFSPASEAFSPYNFKFLEIVEEGSPYALIPVQMGVGSGPFDVTQFAAVPRRSQNLTLKFSDGGPVQTSEIVNPFYVANVPSFPHTAGAVSQSGPSSLPQQLEGGGFIVRLEKVVFREMRTIGTTNLQKAEPFLTVKNPAVKSSDFQYSYEWFDPTGNLVTEGALPWSEPVWGLRVKVNEGNTFPIPPERRITLGDITVPGPGQAALLKVPKEMKNDGVSDVFAVGAGSYSWNGRRMIDNALPQNATTQSLIQVTGVPRFGGISATGFEIFVLSYLQPQSNRDDRARIRVIKGDAVCVSSSSGRSRTNNFQQEHLGSFSVPKVGPLQTGDQIRVETFIPKTYTFEFQIPRPEFTRKSK